CARRQDNFDYW
nr:immunoglobulin heavy chain junction region [Macaca mulatta]